MSGIGGPAHEERVRTLVALAVLAGATTDLRSLPDGRVPDVLRFSQERGLLFVGEAKDTEHARTSEAMVRLGHYLTWVVSHARGGRVSVLALCCRRSAAASWSATLTSLVTEIGWPGCIPSVHAMGPTSGVVTALFPPLWRVSTVAGGPRADEFQDPGPVLVDAAHPRAGRHQVGGTFPHASRVEHRPSALT